MGSDDTRWQKVLDDEMVSANLPLNLRSNTCHYTNIGQRNVAIMEGYILTTFTSLTPSFPPITPSYFFITGIYYYIYNIIYTY